MDAIGKRQDFITMTPNIEYVLVWLTGSLIGYLLSRIVWKKSVEPGIGNDDNVALTLASLILSWFFVAGSLASLLFLYLFSGIDDTEAYWFGKKGQELAEEEERHKSKGV